MDCQDIQKKLEAFLDGELSPEEGKIVSDHLDSCPVCQAEWEALCKLDGLMADNEGLDPGEEAWQRMRDGVGRGITPRRIRSRIGIFEWMQWLVSPRYAVVKVGAAVAVAVIAVLVSRQMSVERFVPSKETVPESAITQQVKSDKEEAVAVEDRGIIEEKTIDHPERVYVQKKDKGQQLAEPIEIIDSKEPESPGVGLDLAEMPPEGVRISTGSVDEEENLVIMDETQAELVSGAVDELPGVEVERELRLQNDTSSKMQEPEAKKTTIEIPTEDKKEGVTLGAARSKGAGTPKDRVTFQAEMARHRIPDSDPLLTMPFSQMSYWEEYQVSRAGEAESLTEVDSLWKEYDRCEEKPCRLDVVPYLADALFRQAIEGCDRETIDKLKPLMESYRERLEDTWGKQRYQVRWEKLLELDN